jgi:hypothetical protein
MGRGSTVKGETAEAMMQAERFSAIKQLIREYTEEHTRSPEAARAALIREGIYTQDSELMPEFGGPAVKPDWRRPLG